MVFSLFESVLAVIREVVRENVHLFHGVEGQDEILHLPCDRVTDRPGVRAREENGAKPVVKPRRELSSERFAAEAPTSTRQREA